jgi:hypothetical protein
MSGWIELTGLARDGGENARDKKAAFWEAVRAQLVRHRYGARPDLSSRDCLDLRESEMLCAPALVKRLFPLLLFPLYEDNLRKIIGWIPFARASDVDFEIETREPLNWKERILAKVFSVQYLTATVTLARAEGPDAEQHPVLWPSTSYIGVATWIGLAWRLAPDESRAFGKAIEEIGPHYARAESSLYMRCVEEPDVDGIPAAQGANALAPIDGAMFFETTHLREIRDAKRDKLLSLAQKDDLVQKHENARQKLLALQDAVRKKSNDAVRATPSDCYALIRADGDNMGRRLKDNLQLSEALNEFALWLRGGRAVIEGEAKIGVVASHNGVTLYAGADEVLAMAPVDDALDLACAIRLAFLDAMETQAPGATISVAVTFAHRQTPLRWVFEDNANLLNSVAKDDMGRNSLGVQILDSGGRRAQWAGPWNTADYGSPAEALRDLANDAARGPDSRLGANEFLHRFWELMQPFAKDWRGAEAPGVGDAKISQALVRHLLADRKVAPAAQCEKLAADIVRACGDYEPIDRRNPEAGHRMSEGPLSASAMQIIRFIAAESRRWRPAPAAASTGQAQTEDATA